MRRLFVFVATWLVLCGSVVIAQQVLPGFPPGAFSNKAALDLAPGGGGTTTFDPSNLGTDATLSNGNLTTTSTGAGASNNYALARSVANHNSGKFYAEFSIPAAGGGITAIGWANSSSAVNLATFPGFDGDSISIFDNGGGIYYMASGAGNGATAISYSAGDIVGIAIDTTAQLVWMVDIAGGTTVGNWNASALASPATGVGGVSYSGVSGPFYLAAWLEDDAGGTYSITLNAGGSTYAITAHGTGVPVGFGNW